MPATYEPIATQTLGSAAATITFSSIAASWTDLRLVLVTNAATTTGTPRLQFNGDTATNYSNTRLTGDGAAASSSRATTQTFIQINGTSSTTVPTFFSIDIFSYAGSTYKTILAKNNTDQNGSGQINATVGLWRDTAAITSFTISRASGDFGIGTTATLYGIEAA